jgi:hypothetical protein
MGEIRNSIYPIDQIVKDYGGDMTIEECIAKIQGKRIHECPACKGQGCSHCSWVGYTEKPLKPKYEQDGWE